jgi:adenylate kinase family enzyme
MIVDYGFTHLSAGDLIRAAAKDSSTEKGRYFNEIMSQGKLISTVNMTMSSNRLYSFHILSFQEDILGLLKSAIYENASKASGFLIDGFPRRVDQGEYERYFLVVVLNCKRIRFKSMFTDLCQHRNNDRCKYFDSDADYSCSTDTSKLSLSLSRARACAMIVLMILIRNEYHYWNDLGIQFEKEVAMCDALIYFDVPDPIMINRLIKRGETSGRIDDNADTISKRLATFHEQTTPILGYYGKQGKLITIDANRKPDEVYTDVTQALQGLVEQHQVGKQEE